MGQNAVFPKYKCALPLAAYLPFLLLLSFCSLLNEEGTQIAFPAPQPEAMRIYVYETKWTGSLKEFPVGVSGAAYSVPETQQSELKMVKMTTTSAQRFLRAFSGEYQRCFLISHRIRDRIEEMPTIFFFARFRAKENAIYVINMTPEGKILTSPIVVKKEGHRFVFSNAGCYQRKLSRGEMEILVEPVTGSAEAVSFSRML